MMRPLRALLRSERGSSVVEMGLAAPFLAALLVGMVDLSRAYSTKLQVEQAAQRAIEKAAQQQSPTDDYSDLQAEAAGAAGVPTGNVTVDFWLECSADGTTWARATDSCPTGQPLYSRYLTVAIRKTYTPLFRIKWDRTTASSYTIRAEAGVRVQ